VGGTHPQAPAALLRALGHVPGGASAGQLGRGGQATLDGGVRAMASCVGRGGGGSALLGHRARGWRSWATWGKEGELEREHGPAERGHVVFPFFFTLSLFIPFI
jgi:hypothetical protein